MPTEHCELCGQEAEKRYQRRDKWVCSECLKPEIVGKSTLNAGKVIENYKTDLKIVEVENEIMVLKAQTAALTKVLKEFKIQKNGILKDIKDGQSSLF